MNFRPRKIQFGIRRLFVWCIVTGIFAGIFARALFAEIVAQQQAVTLELQSKQDWLVQLEKDREELIERLGPYDGRVAKFTRMIIATEKKIEELELQLEAEQR